MDLEELGLHLKGKGVGKEGQRRPGAKPPQDSPPCKQTKPNKPLNDKQVGWKPCSGWAIQPEVLVAVAEVDIEAAVAEEEIIVAMVIRIRLP